MPKIVSDLSQNAIHDIYTISRKDFPPLLQEIPDPPARLFVRGKFSAKAFENSDSPAQTPPKFLCVVGSRRASTYGTDACQTLIRELGQFSSGRNIVIVSGLALGIDGIAHEAALKAGLRTIAVLGSGLDWESVYPRGHMNLAKEIVASGGAIVSELGAGWRPHKYNFPERNRIMAGLSHATLVIEASEKSGTLITARLALDYNRDVFAVPGSIFSDQSKGSNSLIGQGATVIQNARDILAGLGLSEDSSSTGQNALYIEDLGEPEQRVYRALDQPQSRPELLAKLSSKMNMNTSSAIAAISTLEMKGIIVESGDKLRRK